MVSRELFLITPSLLQAAAKFDAVRAAKVQADAEAAVAEVHADAQASAAQAQADAEAAAAKIQADTEAAAMATTIASKTAKLDQLQRVQELELK